MIERLAIVGTGLIGASVGLAARAAGVGDVRGWDVDRVLLLLAVLCTSAGLVLGLLSNSRRI